MKLESLGLSKRESRVYLSLIEIGPTTTSKIIRKTGIASSKIYDVLEKLEHKGLVTYILKNGKMEFHPVNPEKLLDILKEKEATLNEILPNLKELYKGDAEEIQAEIYKGKEGIKSLFEDIIREGKDWCVLGGSGKAATTLPYYMPNFYKRINKNKINLKILFIDEETTRQQAKELKDFNNISINFLPKEIKNLMVIFIYSNKIFIIPITRTTENSPLGVLIKSKESAESYKSYFNWLWRIVKD